MNIIQCEDDMYRLDLSLQDRTRVLIEPKQIRIGDNIFILDDYSKQRLISLFKTEGHLASAQSAIYEALTGNKL